MSNFVPLIVITETSLMIVSYWSTYCPSHPHHFRRWTKDAFGRWLMVHVVFGSIGLFCAAWFYALNEAGVVR